VVRAGPVENSSFAAGQPLPSIRARPAASIVSIPAIPPPQPLPEVGWVEDHGEDGVGFG
jgi:hypothetical protein